VPRTTSRAGSTTQVSDWATGEKDLPCTGTSGMAEGRRARPTAWPEGARMGIADQLNAMRRDFTDCRMATFADLASGLVLFTSADGRVPQEHLEGLCGRAKAIFSGTTGQAASAMLRTPVQQAVLPDDDGLLVLVRSPSEPDEALVCHCTAEIDLPSFTARAARELAALGSAQ